MKVTNLGGFKSIKKYVRTKLDSFDKSEKNLKTLFGFMFSERENVIAESSDGYRINKLTYGECADRAMQIASSLSEMFSSVPKGSLIGIYMENSAVWIQIFWAVLACGYKPLLMNTRLADGVLEGVLADYSVGAVISDSKTFSVHTVTAAQVLEHRGGSGALQNPWEDEVFFMSSGTSGSVKLCAYTGENFYYQICDSVRIIEKCPQTKKHYEGQLKLLAILPLYHVFGFIAMYMWFGFFSRTFVFLKDLNPQTILNTVRKHKVTHIFAVPLVWDTIYKEALRTIRGRGEKTYKKFKKALKIANATGKLGSAFSKLALKEVRENIFGESIRFLISGGSYISPDVLKFFNGIGYHLANGYGMTEIGITSVEISNSKRKLNSASIGYPFSCTQYKLSENGELLVKGRTRATKILQDGKTQVTDFDEWFNTYDLFKMRKGRYFIEGRKDDLIICPNGENINPVIAESCLKIDGCDGFCLIADADNRPVLVVSIPQIFSADRFRGIAGGVNLAIKSANLENSISRVVITCDPLIEGNDFKISRRKIAKKYINNELTVIELKNIDRHIEQKLSALENEVIGCFAEALGKSAEEIATDDNFFTDLGGSSLDYFVLMNLIKVKFNADLSAVQSANAATVKQFCDFIKNN